MRRAMTLLALLALALGGLAACGEDEAAVGTGGTTTTATPPSLPPEEAALAAAEARWAEVGITSYDVGYDVVCFCPQINVQVSVRGGEVASSSVVAPGFEGDTASLVPDPLTVEAMFDELHAAYEGGAATVEVTYDPDTGRPTEYWIDEDEMVADEEHGVTVTAFTALDGSAPPTTGTTQAPLTLQVATAQLTEMWPCGTGFQASDADQTVAVRLGWEGTGDPPERVALPDPSWSAEVQVGADLFANWCDDVLGPGEPTPRVDQRLPVIGGTVAVVVPAEASGGTATAAVQGLRAVLPDGTQVTIPELVLTNDCWGCVAG